MRFLAISRPLIHHDARDWARRVALNGGVISQTTLRHVSTLCAAIDRAGIRDRFYRMGIFAGSNLAAALVPLYRGPSLGGTQYGHATDTNNNFVSTDYVETGANGGLLGNTTSKSLSPGFQTQHFPSVSSTHHAFWWRGGTVAQTWRAIGCFGPTNDHYTLDVRTSAGGGVVARVGNNTNTIGTNYAIESAGSFIAARTSHTDVRLYYNGSSVATSSTNSSTTVLSSTAIEVMSGGGTYFPYRSCGYSFGAGMTQPQAAAFHSAWAEFQAALKRDRPSSDIAFASVTNNDAKLWIDNVYVNGGTVSAGTASAVNTFCNSIDAAGIRDRIYRLNLFCGTGLSACLVPLYRGPSLGGTQYGGATDANVNFSSGDYVETGASGGLNSQGSFTRYLSCGTIASIVDAGSQHMAVYAKLRSGQTSIGGFGMAASGTGWESRVQFRSTSVGRVWIGAQFWGGNFDPVGTVTQNTFVLGSRSASGQFNQFNGVTNGSDIARTTPAAADAGLTVFGQGASSYFDGIMAGYSFGASLTPSQAQALNSAFQTFNSALGRA